MDIANQGSALQQNNNEVVKCKYNLTDIFAMTAYQYFEHTVAYRYTRFEVKKKHHSQKNLRRGATKSTIAERIVRID